jgi:hypothetical protein
MGPLGHGRRHCHRLGRLSVHLLPHRLRGRRFRARGQRHLDSMAPRSLEPPPHPAHGLLLLVDPARHCLERPSTSLETTVQSFEATPKRVEPVRRRVESKRRSIESKSRPIELKRCQVKSKRQSIESMGLPVEPKPRRVESVRWRVEPMRLPVESMGLPVESMRWSLESLSVRLLPLPQPGMTSMLLPLGLPRPRRPKMRHRLALPRCVFSLTTQLLPRAYALPERGNPLDLRERCVEWATWVSERIRTRLRARSGSRRPMLGGSYAPESCRTRSHEAPRSSSSSEQSSCCSSSSRPRCPCPAETARSASQTPRALCRR